MAYSETLNEIASLPRSIEDADKAANKARAFLKALRMQAGQEWVSVTVNGEAVPVIEMDPHTYGPRRVQGRQDLLDAVTRIAVERVVLAEGKRDALVRRLAKLSKEIS